MVLGFNHNIMYKGEVFHVQTEDSGVEIPNIVTLLYKGGVIFCSMKTSYADILKMDNLEDVVEELMKEQHKGMMRRLKSGEFDERISPSEPGAASGETPADAHPPQEPGGAVPLPPSPAAEGDSPGTEGIPPSVDFIRLSAIEPVADDQDASRECRSLDDAILRFFGIHES